MCAGTTCSKAMANSSRVASGIRKSLLFRAFHGSRCFSCAMIVSIASRLNTAEDHVRSRRRVRFTRGTHAHQNARRVAQPDTARVCRKVLEGLRCRRGKAAKGTRLESTSCRGAWPSPCRPASRPNAKSCLGQTKTVEPAGRIAICPAMVPPAAPWTPLCVNNGNHSLPPTLTNANAMTLLAQ